MQGESASRRQPPLRSRRAPVAPTIAHPELQHAWPRLAIDRRDVGDVHPQLHSHVPGAARDTHFLKRKQLADRHRGHRARGRVRREKRSKQGDHMVLIELERVVAREGDRDS